MIIKKLSDGFHIYWTNNIVDRRKAMAARDYVWKLIKFAPVTNDTFDKLKQYAAKTGITINQMLSIKNNHIKDHIIRGYQRTTKNIDQLCAQYDKYSIVTISDNWHMPPLTLMRIIFEKKYPKLNFTKLNVASLSEYDAKQYMMAREHDAEAFFDNVKILELSQKYENDFAEKLRKHGVPFRTQEDISAEQVKERGNAYATPDILFAEPIKIHVGEKVYTVRWIDLKDMCFISGTFMDRKIREQCARYEKIWGPGAFCFHYGYVDGSRIGKTLLLGDNPAN